jgi:GDP-4-dehydro-6-deoxy-D-mannose reductase
MRVLITGVGGFAGSWLAEHCLARTDVEVTGVVRSRARLGNAAALVRRIEIAEADLRSPQAVRRVVAEAKPEVVFHLAGQSFVPRAFEDPVGTLQDNAVGQINVIQAVLEEASNARLLTVGSSTEYGLVRPEESPVDEDVPLRPSDPYGVSKVAQDLYAFQYFVSHGLKTVRVRAFNHTGPRQSEEFVASAFARQIAEIEAGVSAPEMVVGNLSGVRDFTDVRDMVRAYFLAATEGEPGEVYNLGTGDGRRIDQLLGTLGGYSQVHFTIREDESRMRPLDVPSVVCNATKFRQRTSWEPQIPFERTMLDLLDYWRDRVNQQRLQAPQPALALPAP